MVKNLPVMQETGVPSLGQEDPLENGMATHSSILAWRIPWTEEPGGLQSMGSQRDTTEQLTCSLFSRTEAIIAPKPRAVPARVEIPNLPKEEAERRREKGMEEWAWQGATWAFLSRTNPWHLMLLKQTFVLVILRDMFLSSILM